VLLPLVWRERREILQALARDWKRLLFLTAVGGAPQSALVYSGLAQSTAINLGLLNSTIPVLIILISWGWRGRRPRRLEGVGLTVSLTGVVLILAHGDLGALLHLQFNAGDLLMLGAMLVFGSAVCYAVYLVTSSQLVRRIGSMRFTAYATSVASVLCIAQFLLLRPLSALALPPQVYALAAAMGVLCTVLPVFMTSEALKRIGANQVAIIGAAGPVTTIFLGWLGLEEHMTGLQIVGAVLVLGGVMLVTIRPKT